MTRYVHALYCDDIRRETSGKLTLVGLYGSDMVIEGQPPATIPKLNVVVVARTLSDDRFSHLHLEVLQDEEILVQTDIAPPRESRNRSADWVDVRATVEVRNLHVTEECILRVRVTDERAAYKAGGLIIRFSSRGKSGDHRSSDLP